MSSCGEIPLVNEDGHILGGPFYYIENGMGHKWKWLAKIFAFFGVGVGLLGIGTFTQINGITMQSTDFLMPITNGPLIYLEERIHGLLLLRVFY